jgi:hypothetical protein
MAVLKLFTFCVDIGRHTREQLVSTLQHLINSLEKYNDYELHVFKNFYVDIQNTNVKFIEYIDNKSMYKDRWLNLSFNKINIYKHLYDQHNEDFTWIDLDTIITTNIEYINDLDSYFIDCGGKSIDPHNLITNDNTHMIPRNKWIQGNVWKINIKLYDIFMNIVNTLNVTFNYDLQSLYTYYLYYVLDGKLDTFTYNKIFVSGRNYKPNILNGLCVWSREGNTHANLDGLQHMSKNKNGIMCSSFYPGKEIHIISFTFNTLKTLVNTPQFKNLFYNE